MSIRSMRNLTAYLMVAIAIPGGLYSSEFSAPFWPDRLFFALAGITLGLALSTYLYGDESLLGRWRARRALSARLRSRA